MGLCANLTFKVLFTINRLLSPPGGLFISSPFEGGLNRDGGGLKFRNDDGVSFP